MAERLSKRYARAFVEASEEGKALESCLLAFEQVWRAVSDRQVMRFFASPVIGVDEKRELVTDLAKILDLRPEVRNFLFVLIERNRFCLIPQICQELNEFLNQQKQKVDAVIRVARPLCKEAQEKIQQLLESKVKMAVVPRFEEDASLIGGFVGYVGQTMIDGSVAGYLKNLEKELMT